MEKEMVKKRSSNFELLRIVLMFMIVCLHYNGKGLDFSNIKFMSSKYIFSNIVEAFSIVAVNCFVLISGYFLSNSRKIKIKKITHFWITVEIYSFGIFLAMILNNILQPKSVDIIKAIFPITNNMYWFATAYFGLYLIYPFLNILISNLSKKKYIYMLAILTFLQVIVTTLSPFKNGVFDSSTGYSLIWFIYLYFIGAYIRIYYVDNIKRRKYYFIGYILSSISIFLLNILNIYLSKKFNLFKNYIGDSYSYDHILAVIASVMLFLFFKNINIKQNAIGNVINKISPAMFGVYLIHENYFIIPTFWKDIIVINKSLTFKPFLKCYILNTLEIFIACAIISYCVNLIINFCGKILNKYIKLDEIKL